jgi:hypothetical protein
VAIAAIGAAPVVAAQGKKKSGGRKEGLSFFRRQIFE